MIAETLRQELAARFPILRIVAESADGADLTTPARHPDVGDVSISDDGTEATPSIGSFGHSHFSDYRDDISKSMRVEAIVDDVLAFLGMLYSDRVLLWK